MKDNDKIPRFMWEGILMKKAIDTWGQDAQINQTIEECSELSVALNHHRRGRVGKDKVIEELADVQLMINQMLIIFDESKFVVKYDEKLKRLAERLKE